MSQTPSGPPFGEQPDQNPYGPPPAQPPAYPSSDPLYPSSAPLPSYPSSGSGYPPAGSTPSYPQPGSAPSYPQPGYGYPAPGPAYPPPASGPYGSGYAPLNSYPKNKYGVAALVLGIVSLIACGFVTGILAVIFGALSRQAVTRGEADNGGLGLAGIILGAIGTIGSIIGLIIAWPTLMQDLS